MMAAFFQRIYKGNFDLSKHDLACDLRRFGEAQNAFSLHKLSQLFGIGAGHLSQWFVGKHTPSLLRFLEICTAIGVTPLQLLGEEAAPTILPQRRPKRPSRFWSRSERAVVRYDRHDIAHKIVAAHHEHPTLRVNQLAQLVGLGRVKIYHMIPLLAREINQSAAEKCRKRTKARIDAKNSEAERIINNMLAQGIMPTRKLVSNAMTQPGSMRNPALRTFVVERLSALSHTSTAAKPIPKPEGSRQE
jgi:transcriptional regulator with XRE-family HTH domain